MSRQARTRVKTPAAGGANADDGQRSPAYLVVDDFLPVAQAEAMRADIDAHFANPDKHSPDRHQVWNYWFVPELYAYLRTLPDKIIREDRVMGFLGALRDWSFERLGLGETDYPYLSLYVSGCRQNVHNDAWNGRFAFVYSLTRNERETIGGETIIYHEGDPFRTKLRTADAGRGFFDKVEPRFNRLIVFDDRLPHAVDRIDGSMDPVQGRFVLHGHLSEAGERVVGALSADAAAGPLVDAMLHFHAAAEARIELYHGPIVFRLQVTPEGSVGQCRVVLDRVTGLSEGDRGWIQLRRMLIEALSGLCFPSESGSTEITLPLMFGGPVVRRA